MPKAKATRGERHASHGKPNERFLKSDENAAFKQKKGTEKNPNKKRGKKPTLAEKIAADKLCQQQDAAMASPPPPTADRSKVPMESFDLNAEIPAIVSNNPYALLAMLGSPSPAKPVKITAPSPSPAKAVKVVVASPPPSPKSRDLFDFDSFFDAITAFEDFEFLGLDVETLGSPSPVKAVAASPTPYTKSRELFQLNSFFGAILFFEDFTALDFDFEIPGETPVVAEAVNLVEVVAAPPKKGSKKLHKKRNFLDAISSFGDVDYTVSSLVELEANAAASPPVIVVSAPEVKEGLLRRAFKAVRNALSFAVNAAANAVRAIRRRF